MRNIILSHMYVNAVKNEYLNTWIQTNFAKFGFRLIKTEWDKRENMWAVGGIGVGTRI